MNFEDVQLAVKNPEYFVLINTLPVTEQICLIYNTLKYDMEEKVINQLVEGYQFTGKTIIVYGRNTNDDTTERKYKQLAGLGFKNLYLYYGGMFEWMLLQDIYGSAEFPTTGKVLDILKFKASPTLSSVRMLEM